MRWPAIISVGGVALLLAACASTEVTDRQRYEGDQLAQPDRIIVHDFVGDPARVPPESPFADQMAETLTPTAEQREIGRELGAQIAEELVIDLQELGLPAVHAEGEPPPQTDDIVLRGYFVSINEGSAGERVIVGFGRGTAEMSTAVEGYQMTPEGLRLLGTGEVSAGGSRMPGVLAPLAVLAATSSPVGLIVGGGAKAYSEATGADRIEAVAERTADEISEQLEEAALELGLI